RERRLAVIEWLEQPVGGDHGADWGVARRHALGAGDDVGHVAEVVASEHRTDASERADHLVGYQQHVVFVADLADPFEVSGRRREATAGVLHRLEEYWGGRIGPLEFDPLGNAVCPPHAGLLL